MRPDHRGTVNVGAGKRRNILHLPDRVLDFGCRAVVTCERELVAQRGPGLCGAAPRPANRAFNPPASGRPQTTPPFVTAARDVPYLQMHGGAL
ncbi:hypothetical protein HEK616_34720 [Streptomyces nigrescens]|uniref:Uncharacterized protein n=1 Tax=Streptomyces nigrescens TaxID=1920 RepID=A0ABM7ZUD9_STRNI|nr:hypothetical protein HEK616_34720 [Streptomyces nigrescens]